MKRNEKIVLKGQMYATPKTESVVIKNQGVLCGSGGTKSVFNATVGNYSGKGF